MGKVEEKLKYVVFGKGGTAIGQELGGKRLVDTWERSSCPAGRVFPLSVLKYFVPYLGRNGLLKHRENEEAYQGVQFLVVMNLIVTLLSVLCCQQRQPLFPFLKLMLLPSC